MKHRWIIASLAVALSLGVFAGTSLSDDEKPVDPMAAWMEHVKVHKPGPAQKLIGTFNGNWDVKMTMWMAPGMPPQVSKGTSVNSLSFDGRFVQQDYKSTVMGQPFEGRAVIAHDNYTNKYQMVWYDLTSTNINVYEGASKAGETTIVVRGVTPSPSGDMMHQWTYSFDEADKVTAVMHDGPAKNTDPSKMRKAMEIIYTRAAKKDAPVTTGEAKEKAEVK